MRKFKQLLFYIILAITIGFLLLLYQLHLGDNDNQHGSVVQKQTRTQLENRLNSHIQNVMDTSNSQVYTSSNLATEHAEQVMNISTQLNPSRDLTTMLPRPRGVDQILENIRTCLNATNMAESANEVIALENAKEFYQQYSKVIPTEFLSNYSSLCWKMKFNVEISNGFFYKGQFGKYPFEGFGMEQKSLHNGIMYLKKLFNHLMSFAYLKFS